MKSTGIFWIREDFRIENNPALSFATNNHDNVIALYIYNNNEFDNKREAQKWWLFKSLESIKTELSKFKINLEILKGDELDIFSKLKKVEKKEDNIILQIHEQNINGTNLNNDRIANLERNVTNLNEKIDKKFVAETKTEVKEKTKAS